MAVSGLSHINGEAQSRQKGGGGSATLHEQNTKSSSLKKAQSLTYQDSRGVDSFLWGGADVHALFARLDSHFELF